MHNNIESELEDLLSLDFDQIVKNRKNSWDNLSLRNKPFLIFGCGELGSKLLKGLLLEGLSPAAILDNKMHSDLKYIKDIPVMSPSDASQKFEHDILCIVAVYNSSNPRTQLLSLGFKNIIHCAQIFIGMPNIFLPFVCLDATDIIFRQKNHIRHAFELMADLDSKITFVQQLKFRLFMNFDRVVKPQTQLMKSSEYFPDDLYVFINNEVFIDCGAYIGDTIDRFLLKRGSNFKRIFALEPDPINYNKLTNHINSLNSKLSVNIQALQCGVGSKKESLAFNSDYSVLSSISKSGTNSIEVIRLDDLCHDTPATLIKMDIEGSEIDAIIGAQNLINNYSPVLAICVYHACSHLWEIPIICSKFNQDYKFYLRAHAEDCWDVSCYAVPSNRCIKD